MTDQSDYPPGSIAYITGAGFGPGETVQLQVLRIDIDENSGSEHVPWQVQADANGDIQTSWYVTLDEGGATLQLTAEGLTSGLKAQEVFTDSAHIQTVAVGSQTPAAVSPGSTATYQITFTSNGSGTDNGNLSIISWSPSAVGITTNFTPNPVDISSATSVLTITNTASTPVGTYTFTVQVAADATKTATGTYLVRKASSSALTSSLNPAVYGNSMTFTSTVTGSGGTPTGTVTFMDGVSTLGTGTLSSGKAIFSTNKLAVAGSPHSITAVYAGDTTFAGSTSSALSQTITVATVSPVITVSNKVYDATLAASIATRGLTGVVGTDDVNLDTSGSASFPDKIVATGKTVNVTGLALSGATASNYQLSSTTATATANITTRPLTVTATGVNRPYDGTTAAAVNLLDNRVSGDSFTDNSTSATFSTKTVGTGKTVSVSGISISGTDAGNYSLGNTTASTTANITSRTLTVTAAGVDKTYDGTTAATVTLSDNEVSGDSVTDHSTTATFSTKAAANGKTVSVSGISITGTDSGNYTLGNTTATTTANITARTLTVTAAGVNRPYDGTTAATVTLSDNKVSGDSVTDNFTAATFSTKAVGNGKTVSVSGISITGTDSGNYSLGNTTATTTANITAKSLTVTASGVNKPYDGTTAATVNLSDNKVSGDSVTDNFTTATFSTKTVGNGKTVSVSGISITGTDSGNYTLGNTTATTTANITARSLTVTAAGVNKPYDGTTAATVTLSDDKVSGDSVTDHSTSASFSNKNVADGKTVNVSGISITGTDSGNYSLGNTTATTTANITARSFTVTAAGVNKPYDGTTTATVNLSDNKVSGDAVIDSYTAANFNTKDVGTGKAVSVSGISIGGTDAANYSLANTTASASASITQAGLSITAADGNKTYGDTLSFAGTEFTASGLLSGDSVTSVSLSSTGSAATAGAATYSIIPSSAVGTGLANYSIAYHNGSLVVDPAGLAIVAKNQTRAYGQTNPVLTVTYSGFVNSDTAGNALGGSPDLSTSANTNSTVAGSPYVIHLNPGTLTAANYMFLFQSGNLYVTQAVLTVSADNLGKVYGDTNPVLTASFTGFVNAEGTNVLSGAPDLITTAGDSSPVGPYPIMASLGSLAADNYSFEFTNGTLLVATASLTPHVTAIDKVYDGTNSATLSSQTLSGVIGLDDVSLVVGNARFDDKNVGDGKTVTASTLSLGGGAAANYILGSNSATTTAKITPASLHVTATAQNKPYDAGTAATVSLSDDRIRGDDLTPSYASADFDNKNAGSGKTVSVSGISLAGTDAGNYTFNSSTTATADIAALSVTVTAVSDTKPYDATTSSAGVPMISPVLAGSDTGNFSQSFDTKNVGTGKTLTPAGSIDDGNSGNNYAVQFTADTTGAIMPSTLTPSIAAAGKAYDGTSAVTITNRSVHTVLGTDDVSLTVGSAAFSDKNAGLGKTVTATGLGLTGGDAGNYELASDTATTSADITGLTASVTGLSADNKVYDGTTTATLSGTAGLSGIAPTDSVSLTGTPAGNFSDSNAGLGKSVTISGLGLGGPDSGNYTLAEATVTADITPASTQNTVSSSSNPALPGSDVVFTATLSPVAPGGGAPEGTVQFLADGLPLGVPVAFTNGTASITNASLAHGSHAITAEYAGDGNFFGSTNDLSPNEVINTPPVIAANPGYTRSRNAPWRIGIAALLNDAQVSDVDAGDTVSLMTAGPLSANNASVASDGTYLYYTPAGVNPNAADTFTFTVSDPLGGVTQGTVSLSVAAIVPVPVTINYDAVNNVVQLKFSGLPGSSYQIQWASGAGGPWTSFASVNADSFGRVIYNGPGPSQTTAFFRVVVP